LALVEGARRVVFPRAVAAPRSAPTPSTTRETAMQAVREISRRVQEEDPPLEQPDVLQKVAHNVLLEVLETVAGHYQPHVDRPLLQAPVAHIAAIVELVARDFRRAFGQKVPWGNTVTPRRLLWWKEKGELGWQILLYLWQINRIRRLVMRPSSALLQELQDHWGQNMATQSVAGVKRWAIDYCVMQAGEYAIQLYSGEFILGDEYRPRVSAAIQSIPFDQEPLQILVVGQVKAGKSSLINALVGAMRAPVDALPVTDQVDLYECQPEGFPPLLLHDTPGYGQADDGDPFSRLQKTIEECDLLMLVCSARSAARQADRELLRAVRAFYQNAPKRRMPPVVHILTHIDRIPEPLIGEAVESVATDLDTTIADVAPVCTRWGRFANMESVAAALRARLEEAERLKVSRCIRQIRKEKDEDNVLRQLMRGLRLTGGWMAGR
jgi:GTPase Era involved in 16S rRNA processing